MNTNRIGTIQYIFHCSPIAEARLFSVSDNLFVLFSCLFYDIVFWNWPEFFFENFPLIVFFFSKNPITGCSDVFRNRFSSWIWVLVYHCSMLLRKCRKFTFFKVLDFIEFARFSHLRLASVLHLRKQVLYQKLLPIFHRFNHNSQMFLYSNFLDFVHALSCKKKFTRIPLAQVLRSAALALYLEFVNLIRIFFQF